jgi:hypothetical protein
LRLIYDWSKGKMLLVQGDLQGLAATTEEEERVQKPHTLHEYLLREGRDTLLGGKDDLQFTDFFGLQGDAVERHQGDDLDKKTTGLRAEGKEAPEALIT